PAISSTLGDRVEAAHQRSLPGGQVMTAVALLHHDYLSRAERVGQVEGPIRSLAFLLRLFRGSPFLGEHERRDTDAVRFDLSSHALCRRRLSEDHDLGFNGREAGFLRDRGDMSDAPAVLVQTHLPT